MGLRGLNAKPLGPEYRKLTKNELRVAPLMVEPLTAQEIADRLGVTARTVRNARARLIAEGYFEVVDSGHGRGRRPVYRRIDN